MSRAHLQRLPQIILLSFSCVLQRLMKAMSTLSGQRERVRKYAAAHATVGSTREDADRNHASLKV